MGAQRPRRSLVVLLSALVVLLAAGASGAAGAKAPTAPRSVRASADADSVTLTWKRPRATGDGRVDKYQVVRWAAGVARRASTVRAPNRSLDVRGLQPATAYRFTVRAHNRAGWGPASAAVTAQLVPTTPPTSPPPAPPGPPPPQQPLPGFGTVAGPCGSVAPQLPQPTPAQLDNRLDFGADAFDPADLALLTAGGQEVYNAPSSGGSTTLSEVFAFEVLARCEGASLLKTETEIDYQAGYGATTDLLVQVGASRVGVMVTRAFRPPPVVFTQSDATTLLTHTLEDVNESSQYVAPADGWVKQVLVVVAVDDDAATKIRTAWGELSGAIRADTVVYVVTTDGADQPLY